MPSMAPHSPWDCQSHLLASTPQVSHLTQGSLSLLCPQSSMAGTIKRVTLPLPQGLLAFPEAWSYSLLKLTSPAGQDPDGAKVHRHLALHPGYVSPRARRSGARVWAGRQGGDAGLPTGSQLSHLPHGNSSANLVGSSEDWSQVIWQLEGPQKEVPTSSRGSRGSVQAFEGQRRDPCTAFLAPPGQVPLEGSVGWSLQGLA